MATAKIVPAPLTRPLAEIAREIEQDYRSKGKPVYYAAVPYVTALRQTSAATGLDGKFYEDDVEDVIIRLLGNLSTWRGETATRVKAELRAALAYHKLSPAERREALLQARLRVLEASRQTELFTVVAEGEVTV